MPMTREELGKLLYDTFSEESTPSTPYAPWEEVPEFMREIFRVCGETLKAAVLSEE